MVFGQRAGLSGCRVTALRMLLADDIKSVVGLLITDVNGRLLALYMGFRALKDQALQGLPLLFLLLLILVRLQFLPLRLLLLFRHLPDSQLHLLVPFQIQHRFQFRVDRWIETGIKISESV